MAYGVYREKLQLPHPPISLRVFLIVEMALRTTWKLMRENPRPEFNLNNADEDIVTHELYECLYDEVFKNRLVEGFDRQLFADFRREPKIRNYDGTHLDKMPDLFFCLLERPIVKLPSQDGLYTECKPVDSDHTVGHHYCDKGIIRFTRGHYAWTMTSALMIGYVQQGYSITPKLVNALKKSKTITTIDLPIPCHRSSATECSEATHVTRHTRSFSYMETGEASPPITIRHLWLMRAG